MNNLDEKLLKIKEEAILNHVPILNDESLQYILVMLNIIKPNKILEIGTAVGYSASNFSKYLSGENSKITSIEIKENMYKKSLENIEYLGLTNKIEVVLADATVYLKNIDEKQINYDVIFIDAAKGQYIKFLEEAIRLIRPGGVIIADNVLFKGRVMSDYNDHKHRTAVNRLREYIDIINSDSRLNSTVLDIGDGVAITVVNK